MISEVRPSSSEPPTLTLNVSGHYTYTFPWGEKQTFFLKVILDSKEIYQIITENFFNGLSVNDNTLCIYIIF